MPRNTQKISFIAALALAAAAFAGSAAAQPDVGVSVNIGQPGFYGRLDLGGNAPPPQLLYPQPIIVQPPPRVVQQPAPIYLRVPPGHARDWRRHCARYQACGQPVYFVQDRWYRDVYAPRYRMGPPPGYYGPPQRFDRDHDWRHDRRDESRRWERERDYGDRDRGSRRWEREYGDRDRGDYGGGR